MICETCALNRPGQCPTPDAHPVTECGDYEPVAMTSRPTDAFEEWRKWYRENCPEWDQVQDIEAELGRKEVPMAAIHDMVRELHAIAALACEATGEERGLWSALECVTAWGGSLCALALHLRDENVIMRATLRRAGRRLRDRIAQAREGAGAAQYWAHTWADAAKELAELRRLRAALDDLCAALRQDGAALAEKLYDAQRFDARSLLRCPECGSENIEYSAAVRWMCCRCGHIGIACDTPFEALVAWHKVTP